MYGNTSPMMIGTETLRLPYLPATSSSKKTAGTHQWWMPAVSVGVTGFEPATPCSQSRCATGLRYAPSFVKSVANVQLLFHTGKQLGAFLTFYRYRKPHGKKYLIYDSPAAERTTAGTSFEPSV